MMSLACRSPQHILALSIGMAISTLNATHVVHPANGKVPPEKADSLLPQHVLEPSVTPV